MVPFRLISTFLYSLDLNIANSNFSDNYDFHHDACHDVANFSIKIWLNWNGIQIIQMDFFTYNNLH